MVDFFVECRDRVYSSYSQSGDEEGAGLEVVGGAVGEGA